MPNPSSHTHIVQLPVSRAALDARFERVFKACRLAADTFSEGDCRIEAVHEAQERVGYRFAFRDAMTAFRLHLYHASVVQGRPTPLEAWR